MIIQLDSLNFNNNIYKLKFIFLYMIPKRNIQFIKDKYTKYFGEVNELGQKDGYGIEYMIDDNSRCYVG